MLTSDLSSTPGGFWQQLRGSLRLGFKTMFGRAYPRLISATREPDWIFYEILLPVLWMVAAQLHWERVSGNLELYLIATASMLWILAGMAYGGILITLIRAVFIVLAGSLIFGVTYQIVSLPLLILVFSLTLVAL